MKIFRFRYSITKDVIVHALNLDVAKRITEDYGRGVESSSVMLTGTSYDFTLEEELFPRKED